MAKILVLCGGDNPERRVSLSSGDAVGKGLLNAGHDVIKIDTSFPDKIVPGDVKILENPVGVTPPDELDKVKMTRSKWEILTESIVKNKVDVIFPMLHGSWGEDGHIQAYLDLLNIPYLGSGMVASARAIDKHSGRLYASMADLPIAGGFLVGKEASVKKVLEMVKEEIGLPVVVKPNKGGSSADLTISDSEEKITKAIKNIHNTGDNVLIEEFIDGRELTVGILDGKALPMIEIAPKDGFYDYTNKYTHGKTEYLCPAPIENEVASLAMEMSEDLFEIIGCRHFGRVDWRLTPDNELVFLEVNTIPGMTSLSLVPMAAKEIGMDFPKLMDEFVRLVLK